MTPFPPDVRILLNTCWPRARPLSLPTLRIGRQCNARLEHVRPHGLFGRSRLCSSRASPNPALAADDAASTAFFESKIRPVLVERCYECHSSEAKKLRGGLRLDSREATRTGGDTGPAVVPGKLDESLLFQAITAAKGVEPMPPKGKLPARVVADFREWIKMGAPDPRDGKAVAASADERRASSDWWAIKPLSRPAVPRARRDAAGLAWQARSTPSSWPSFGKRASPPRPKRIAAL